ncbi:hypothetical protein HX823_03365 [Pseudomonas sp. P7759]|uniref:hypothetical protein n=1 Tax=Pseudomonas sp. P7759 TaxID=2738831 RepID=UPI0015A0E9E6|nr:hypothetical protein [Pseudomonas sp. P7759]NWC73110.1 hypothetical protein [Pseudomonas sp. P7759]
MMKLQKNIKSTLGWFYSLGRKFYEVTPAATLTVLTANLFAQILLVLTFFLPIKVLILLGSDTVPKYYPLYLKSLQKAHLIVGLSLLALMCYLLYLGCEFIIAHHSRKGAQKLLKNSGKLALFENQHQLASQAYARFTRGLSAGTFAAASLAILLYIYPLLFSATLTYCALAYIGLVSLYNKSPKARRLLEHHHATTLNAMCSMGFLFVFACMIIDFLYLSPPKIFPALISLLLIRQGMSRLNILLQDIIALRSQHRQINALFFHNQQLIVDNGTYAEKITELLNKAQRDQWVAAAIKSVTSADLQLVSTQWHQIGRTDIYSFEAEFTSAQSPNIEKYLFKLFGEHSKSLAEQEYTLLKNTPHIPAPQFLGRAGIQNLTCHVFNFNNYRKLAHREIGTGVISINQRLLCIEPSESLVKRFSRSHQYLEQRLSRKIIENLHIISSQEQVADIERFSEQYDFLISVLADLPRQIISLDTTSDTLLIAVDGTTHVSHWASWKMEPLGSNWPVGEHATLRLGIETARQERKSLVDVPAAAVLLCAFTYAFERLCHRSNFSDAVALLPNMLEQLEHLKTPRNEQEQ